MAPEIHFILFTVTVCMCDVWEPWHTHGGWTQFSPSTFPWFPELSLLSRIRCLGLFSVPLVFPGSGRPQILYSCRGVLGKDEGLFQDLEQLLQTHFPGRSLYVLDSGFSAKHSIELIIRSMSVIPTSSFIQRRRQEDKEFKIILGCTGPLKPA